MSSAMMATVRVAKDLKTSINDIQRLSSQFTTYKTSLNDSLSLRHTNLVLLQNCDFISPKK